MEIKLPCETYVRLSKIAAIAPDDFKSIYIERKNGITVAIATNRYIAAIERLPDANEDGSVLLLFDPVLLTQCEAETQFNGNLEIVVNSMLQFASAKTSFGFSYPGNVSLPDVSPEWERWRNWLPDAPAAASVGGMFWGENNIAALSSSAPSGKVVFPQFIDCSKPVIIRDHIDEKWLGLFMPLVHTDEGKTVQCDGATLPGWLK